MNKPQRERLRPDGQAEKTPKPPRPSRYETSVRLDREQDEQQARICERFNTLPAEMKTLMLQRAREYVPHLRQLPEPPEDWQNLPTWIWAVGQAMALPERFDGLRAFDARSAGPAATQD